MRWTAAALLLVALFLDAHAEPLTEFWRWFEANSERLASNPEGPETVEDMDYWLGRIHQGLSYQIRSAGRKKELILSADGEMRLFPIVDQLARQAPRTKGWKITALRRKQRLLEPVTVGEATIDPAQVFFDLYDDGARFGVVLYVPRPNDDHLDDYRIAAIRLMSQAVGEREIGNWIGFVDLDRHGVRDMEFSRPFAEFEHVFKSLRK
jgi:hypothetical protein